MQHLTFNDNKVYNISILHYVTAAIILLFISILISANSSHFIGHYFHPKILAITHLTTIGWISIIIIGSLYQLIPVITNSKLYCVKLGYISYCLIILGLFILTYSFWKFNVGLLIQIASILVFLGVCILFFNIYLTINSSKEKNIELDFIGVSLLWFWLTVFLGTLLAFNFRFAFLNKDHLYFLKIHAHIGLLGWFLNLVFGVASKLVPMFLLSGTLNKNVLKLSYYIINVCLFIFVIDSVFFNGIKRSYIYLSALIFAIILFGTYIYKAFKTRLKKQLDIGLLQTLIAFIVILIPIVLWSLLKLKACKNSTDEMQLNIALVYSILLGFFTILIFGQTYKNLSFISWLKIYSNYPTTIKKPMPKDLYSNTIAKTQISIYLIAFILLLYGILTSTNYIIKFGSILMIFCSLLYLANVIKIVFHKPKTFNSFN
jgi:hypothetical protein